MKLLLSALGLALAAQISNAWIAVSPVDRNSNTVDIFELDDTGAKTKDVLTFQVSSGETIDPNAFACGRCFCLILTTNVARATSYMYNMSFCLVPTPVITNKVTLPGIAYNLHSAEGEGDGGNGYSLLITQGGTSFEVIQQVGNTTNSIVDISNYVTPHRGNVYPGGTAFCATSLTLWVAVQTRNPAYDLLLTVDVGAGRVTGNMSITKPALTAHFADCSVGQVGGLTQVTGGNGVSTIQMGMLTPAGTFNVLDSLDLPAGSPLRLAGIADYMHDARWAGSEYGAVLYAGSPEVLPGALFTSTAKKSGPAKLSNLAVAVASVSVEY